MTEPQKQFNDLLDKIDEKMCGFLKELREIDVFIIPQDEFVETEWINRTQNYLDDVRKSMEAMIWSTASNRVKAEIILDGDLARDAAEEKIRNTKK